MSIIRFNDARSIGIMSCIHRITMVSLLGILTIEVYPDEYSGKNLSRY